MPDAKTLSQKPLLPRLLLLCVAALLLANIFPLFTFPNIQLKETDGIPESTPLMRQFLDRPVSSPMPLVSFTYYWAEGLPAGMRAVPQAIFSFLMAVVLFGSGLAIGSWLTAVLAPVLLFWFLKTPAYGIVLENPDYIETMLFAFSCAMVAYALLLRGRVTKRSWSTELPLAGAIGFAFLVKSPLALLPLTLAGYDIVSGKLRRGETSWKLLIMLCLAPFAMLLPWIYMNWRVYGIFTVFEHNRAAQNIISGALGLIYTVEGAFAMSGLERGAPLLLWAVKTVLAHPLDYISSVLQRIYTEFSWYPLTTTAFISALFRFRQNEQFRLTGVFVIYFICIHSLLSIDARYFYPLWPVFILGASALLSSGASEAASSVNAAPRKIFAALAIVLVAAYLSAGWKMLAFAQGAEYSTAALTHAKGARRDEALAYAAQIERHEGKLDDAYAHAREALLKNNSYENVKTYAYTLVAKKKSVGAVFQQRLLNCTINNLDCLLIQSAAACEKNPEESRRLFQLALKQYKSQAFCFNNPLDLKRKPELYQAQQRRAENETRQHLSLLLGYMLPQNQKKQDTNILIKKR